MNTNMNFRSCLDLLSKFCLKSLYEDKQNINQTKNCTDDPSILRQFSIERVIYSISFLLPPPSFKQIIQLMHIIFIIFILECIFLLFNLLLQNKNMTRRYYDHKNKMAFDIVWLLDIEIRINDKFNYHI